MLRTKAEANDNNMYSEGNPSLGIPATVVGALEMNNIQEEIALTVEEAGLTVDQTGATLNQLQQAIKILVDNGGSVNTSMSIVDNQSSAADVTALPVLDKTIVKSAKIYVDVFRRDDTQSANELYEIAAIYDPENDTWNLASVSQGDDAGITFSITTAGQLQYISSSYGGANYAGTFRISHIKKILL